MKRDCIYGADGSELDEVEMVGLEKRVRRFGSLLWMSLQTR